MRREAMGRDPWLMAAEIAVATVAELPAKMVTLARAALVGRRHDPYHLGEVASALATLEANAGNNKAARKLFQREDQLPDHRPCQSPAGEKRPSTTTCRPSFHVSPPLRTRKTCFTEGTTASAKQTSHHSARP